MCQSFNIFYACKATAQVVCPIAIPATEIHLKAISKQVTEENQMSHASDTYITQNGTGICRVFTKKKKNSHSCHQLNTCNPPTTNTTLLLETSSSHNEVL